MLNFPIRPGCLRERAGSPDLIVSSSKRKSPRQARDNRKEKVSRSTTKVSGNRTKSSDNATKKCEQKLKFAFEQKPPAFSNISNVRDILNAKSAKTNGNGCGISLSSSGKRIDAKQTDTKPDWNDGSGTKSGLFDTEDRRIHKPRRENTKEASNHQPGIGFDFKFSNVTDQNIHPNRLIDPAEAKRFIENLRKRTRGELAASSASGKIGSTKAALLAGPTDWSKRSPYNASLIPSKKTISKNSNSSGAASGSAATGEARFEPGSRVANASETGAGQSTTGKSHVSSSCFKGLHIVSSAVDGANSNSALHNALASINIQESHNLVKERRREEEEKRRREEPEEERWREREQQRREREEHEQKIVLREMGVRRDVKFRQLIRGEPEIVMPTSTLDELDEKEQYYVSKYPKDKLRELLVSSSKDTLRAKGSKGDTNSKSSISSMNSKLSKLVTQRQQEEIDDLEEAYRCQYEKFHELREQFERLPTNKYYPEEARKSRANSRSASADKRKRSADKRKRSQSPSMRPGSKPSMVASCNGSHMRPIGASDTGTLHMHATFLSAQIKSELEKEKLAEERAKKEKTDLNLSGNHQFQDLETRRLEMQRLRRSRSQSGGGDVEMGHAGNNASFGETTGGDNASLGERYLARIQAAGHIGGMSSRFTGNAVNAESTMKCGNNATTGNTVSYQKYRKLLGFDNEPNCGGPSSSNLVSNTMEAVKDRSAVLAAYTKLQENKELVSRSADIFGTMVMEEITKRCSQDLTQNKKLIQATDLIKRQAFPHEMTQVETYENPKPGQENAELLRQKQLESEVKLEALEDTLSRKYHMVGGAIDPLHAQFIHSQKLLKSATKNFDEVRKLAQKEIMSQHPTERFCNLPEGWILVDRNGKLGVERGECGERNEDGGDSSNEQSENENDEEGGILNSDIQSELNDEEELDPIRPSVRKNLEKWGEPVNPAEGTTCNTRGKRRSGKRRKASANTLNKGTKGATGNARANMNSRGSDPINLKRKPLSDFVVLRQLPEIPDETYNRLEDYRYQFQRHMVLSREAPLQNTDETTWSLWKILADDIAKTMLTQVTEQLDTCLDMQVENLMQRELLGGKMPESPVRVPMKV